MAATVGVLLALGAMLCWGFGDFLIQKGTRQLGVLESLFLIGGFGSVVLFPFAWSGLSTIMAPEVAVLLGLALLVTFSASIINFMALKRGKLSVIQPVMGLEVPFAVLLGIVLLGEHLSVTQYLLLASVFLGVLLVSSRRLSVSGTLERGVVWAIGSALLMALVDVLMGAGSRVASPLVTVWFVHTGLAVIAFPILLFEGRVSGMLASIKRHPRIAFGQAVLDNAAWLCFTFAVLYLPVAIALAISESYILVSAALGLAVNHERLVNHQYLGGVVALGSVVALSLLL